MKTSEELTSYVQKKLRKGYPQGELTNELLQEGYAQEQINEAVYNSSAITGGKVGKTSNNPLWFVITTGLGITGISLVSVPFLSFLRGAGYPFIIIGAAGIFIKFLLPFLDKKAPENR